MVRSPSSSQEEKRCARKKRASILAKTRPGAGLVAHEGRSPLPSATGKKKEGKAASRGCREMAGEKGRYSIRTRRGSKLRYPDSQDHSILTVKKKKKQRGGEKKGKKKNRHATKSVVQEKGKRGGVPSFLSEKKKKKKHDKMGRKKQASLSRRVKKSRHSLVGKKKRRQTHAPI